MKTEEKVFLAKMREWLRECMATEIARVQLSRGCNHTPDLERGKAAAEVLERLARTYTLLSRRGKP